MLFVLQSLAKDSLISYSDVKVCHLHNKTTLCDLDMERGSSEGKIINIMIMISYYTQKDSYS